MTERRETDRPATSGSIFPADGERIAKYLASAGVASRRDVEKMIAEGRVKVDGRVLDTPAFKVTGREKILIDNNPVSRPDVTRMWRYHKPAGLVTTNKDPEGRPTIFDELPKDLPRVVTIGRLDLNTEGLLLLTNDGELARGLELPATGLERKYRARAYGRIEQRELDRLRDGIVHEGEEYRSIIAKLDRVTGSNCWIDVTLAEGKKREVRRALESLGLKVNRLIRVSYGPFELDDLGPGALEEIPAASLLAEVSQFISERRRPQPFSRRDVKRGKPQHEKQEKPKGKSAPAHKPRGDDRRSGVDSYVDKRKDQRPDPRKPSGGKPGARPHSGKRHTGRPVREKAPRGPRGPR